MGRVADRAGRTVPALAACVTLLSVWDIVVRPVLPSELHPAGGLVVAGCTVALGLWAGLDADGLGLSPAPARRWPALRRARVRRRDGSPSPRVGDPRDARLVPLRPSGHHGRAPAAPGPSSRSRSGRWSSRSWPSAGPCSGCSGWRCRRRGPSSRARSSSACGTSRRCCAPHPVPTARCWRPRPAPSWRPSRRACCSAGCGSAPEACWRRPWLTWRPTRVALVVAWFVVH